MIGHLGLERSFQNRFGQLLEQTVFPDDILGLLVVGEQLINQLLVDCHGVFHFLPPIAVYTVLFTPSARTMLFLSTVLLPLVAMALLTGHALSQRGEPLSP